MLTRAKRPPLYCKNVHWRGRVWTLLVIVGTIALPSSVRAQGSVSAGVAPAGVSPGDSSSVSSSLAATYDVPWNPPSPMSSRQPWERAVLLPGRIVSLPLSGIGYVMRRSLLAYEGSHGFATHTKTYPASGWGIRPKLAALGSHTGVGLGIEAHAPLLSGALGSTLDARYTGTTSHYNSALLGLSGRPLSLQYGYDWRPREPFYGIGRDASEDSVSDFATQREFVLGTLRWPLSPDSAAKPPTMSIRLWGGPRSQVTRNGREPARASYERRFPALAAPTLDRRIEHLVYGASISHDLRAGHPHWARGERMLLAAERYDDPIRALALHDGEARGARFTRYTAETEVGASFMRDPRSLRLLLRAIDQRVDSGHGPMLLSDLATLGGSAGLGGFETGRFRDNDLLLARLTYLFPLQRRFELDVHSEWGAVYDDVWHDPRWNTLSSSVGFAVRLRSDLKPIASAGVDVSRESLRLKFTLKGLE